MLTDAGRHKKAGPNADGGDRGWRMKLGHFRTKRDPQAIVPEFGGVKRRSPGGRV